MLLIDIRYNFDGENTHINIKLKVKKDLIDVPLIKINANFLLQSVLLIISE